MTTDTELRVLAATLASQRPLHRFSLLLGALCAGLVLLTPSLAATLAALIGLVAAAAHTYWHWRGLLDSALLPILAEAGAPAFDSALARLFPGAAQRLQERDLASRLAGARRLLRHQCYWLVLQLLGTTAAVGLHRLIPLP